MAKETMKLGEQFSAKVVSGSQPPPPDGPKPRHYAIGYGVIAAVLGALIWWITGSGPHQPTPATMQERPGLIEHLGTKIGGYLTIEQIRAGSVIQKWGPFHNTIVNEGETLLRDCFNNNAGTACTNIANLEFHGIGTSATAIGEGDGGCLTELTTQYNPDN